MLSLVGSAAVLLYRVISLLLGAELEREPADGPDARAVGGGRRRCGGGVPLAHPARRRAAHRHQCACLMRKRSKYPLKRW